MVYKIVHEGLQIYFVDQEKSWKIEVTDSSHLLDSTDDDLDLAYIQSEFQKVVFFPSFK